MAKKSRRARKRQGKTRSAPKSDRQTSPAGLAARPSELRSTAFDLEDYQYVVADLRRVAILAAAMFALLVALSFFLR